MFVSIKIDRWFRAVFRGLLDNYKDIKTKLKECFK